MKASIAVASAILAAATVMLASGPAQATHKASCGKRWVEAGYFYVDKNCPFLTSSAHNKAAQSARGQCKNELKERGEDTYGASFSGLEKFSSNCVLQKEGDICKFWCVCSAEPCWQSKIIIKPPFGDNKLRKVPFPDRPGTDLRVPNRAPAGLSIPNLRRR